MRRALLLLAVTVAIGSRAIQAGPPTPVIVELFTSEGCSDCPPADTLLEKMIATPPVAGAEIIGLGQHVDYWDRLGWKDPFANRGFTDRQEWYARSKKLRSPDGQVGIDGIYTPQMIVDGVVHFSGQRRQDAIREMQRAAAQPPLFDLAADGTIHGSTVDLTVQVADRGTKRELDWRVVVALAATKTRTAVARGENAGETLDEAAVVRALSDRIPVAHGPRGSVTVRLTRPADLPWSGTEVVVFVQSETTGEVGAAFIVDSKRVTVR
jgi:hypothetical protein